MLSLSEAVRFVRSLRSDDTGIYVASGPNAHRCNEFSGDLIGINNTWRLMRRAPILMLTQFEHYLDVMDPSFVPWVLCPSQVGSKEKGGPVDPAACAFPADRLRTFEIREEKSLDAEKIAERLKDGRMPAMLRFGGIGTYGLIFCALAGYRRIVCCGHDGGTGRHAALHDSEKPKTKLHDENLKRTRALAAALVRHGHCHEIVFAQDL